MSKVLIVEDDPALARALRAMFKSNDFDAQEVGTGEAAVTLAPQGGIDVIVLDLGLPDIDGVEVLRRIRTFCDTPVVVLTVHHEQREKVRALDIGADDYITKPFDTAELFARIRAVLRRSPQAPPIANVARIDDIEIDLANLRVTRAGELVHLTRTELALLELLVRNPGKLLTHQAILREVWGPEYGGEAEYLRVYVGQLRKKLGDNAANPRLILTEPGIGYRWIAAED